MQSTINNIIISMFNSLTSFTDSLMNMGTVVVKSTVIATTTVATTSLHLLFTGDIFLDRHIDELTQADNKRIERENQTRKPNLPLYTYPFQNLDTLSRREYDAWIGNLECPVTDRQSTKKQKEVELRFSCKKEYLPELKKYFDIVSLANNHTDNMGAEGFTETKKHLDNERIKYFGHYNSSKSDEICKVINIENSVQNMNLRNPQISVIPVAFCGYHGVYKLPTDKELSIIKEFSTKYFTIVMPHQGEEYKFKNNSYQKIIYRKMIDNGADVVIGAHPHVVQNVEEYKGKLIFYSLGNFIFDQSWSKTREHMVIDLQLEITQNTQSENSKKPHYVAKYRPIFTNASVNFQTKKESITEKDYQNKLILIGFDKISRKLKQ